MRIFTWHVHGAYLRSLLSVEHEWIVPFRPDGSPGYAGLPDDGPPWPPNVRAVPADRVRDEPVDVVVFQHRDNWTTDQHEILSPAQRAGPRIHVEHDPPRASPTDERHPVEDPGVLLVHVTPYNRLMWDSGETPTTVIEHGVPDAGARWTGELDRGLVVVNHLARRGRRLGADVYARARERADLPLDLVGMAAEESPGGLGEVKPDRLPAFQARYRFLFNPIRYTSLGLAVCEAMMVGLPVVALATTQHATAVEDGVSGFVDADEDVLHERMRELLADRGLAARLSEGARERARARFGLERFVADWTAALEAVRDGSLPPPR